MTETKEGICIYPGCEREAVARHELGGPRPRFCDLEEHNASSAHIARKAADEAATATGSKAG